QHLADAGLDGRDELLWNRAADDAVREHEALLGIRAPHLEPHVTVLSAPARLSHIARFGLRRARDRLAVGHLFFARAGAHRELALEPVDQDLEVQLSHSRN